MKPQAPSLSVPNAIMPPLTWTKWCLLPASVWVIIASCSSHLFPRFLCFPELWIQVVWLVSVKAHQGDVSQSRVRGSPRLPRTRTTGRG